MNTMIDSFMADNQPVSTKPKAASSVNKANGKNLGSKAKNAFGKALQKADQKEPAPHKSAVQPEQKAAPSQASQPATTPVQQQAADTAAQLAAQPQLAGTVLAQVLLPTTVAATVKKAATGNGGAVTAKEAVTTSGTEAAKQQLLQLVQKAGFLPEQHGEQDKQKIVLAKESLQPQNVLGEALQQAKTAKQPQQPQATAAMTTGKQPVLTQQTLAQVPQQAAQQATGKMAPFAPLEQLMANGNNGVVDKQLEQPLEKATTTKPKEDAAKGLFNALFDGSTKHVTLAKAAALADQSAQGKQAQTDAGKLLQTPDQHAPANDTLLAQQHFAAQLDKALPQQEVPQNIEQPVQPKEVFNQIVSNARLLQRNDSTQMVINLHPDHLGALALKISVEANGMVNASFHTDNSQVRAMIETSLIQLRQDLQAQGVKVDNINVYSGLGDLLQQQGRENPSEQGQKKNHYRIDAVEAAGQLEDMGLSAVEQAAEAATVETSYVSDEGVDYKI